MKQINQHKQNKQKRSQTELPKISLEALLPDQRQVSRQAQEGESKNRVTQTITIKAADQLSEADKEHAAQKLGQANKKFKAN